MLIEYLEDVKSVLRLFELSTGAEVTTIPLRIGSIGSIASKRKSNEVFFSFMSFVDPVSIYRIDLSDTSDLTNLSVETVRATKFSAFDPEEFSTEQVFYPSKDGTIIPMFVISKNTMKLDGSNPCILFAYGSHGVSVLPSFSSLRIPWLSMLNGILCIANVRGGGEYGEEWHNAGKGSKKHVAYDDFLAAAEYLIEHNYTSSETVFDKYCYSISHNNGHSMV